MGEDGGGVALKGSPDHFAGVNRSVVDGAVEELLAVEDAVPVVEPKDVEFFVGSPARRMRRK